MNVKHGKIFGIALIALFMFVFGITATGEASAPVVEWARSYGGSGADWANAIQQTRDGGYIVAGMSSSNDGDVTGNRGRSDFWVVRLNSIGDIIWQRSLGGSWEDAAYSVQQTADGGYIVAGNTNSSDGDVSQSRGVRDGWVVKLDENGEIEWERTFGGSRWESIREIKQTADGGYIFTGSSNSSDGDLAGLRGRRRRSNVWVVKLDANGEIVWQRLYGGTQADGGRAIQQTKDGGYIVAASSSSSDGDVSVNRGGQDFWIIKLDAVGNIVWQRTFGGSGDDVPASIRQTTDGGYIVAGYTESNDGDVSGNNGLRDFWIIRLDAEGNLIWQRALGGTRFDQAACVQQTRDGGFIIVGESNSRDGDVSQNNGGVDFWVVKLDAGGNLIWEKSLGGPGGEGAQSVQQTSDGGYIIAGGTTRGRFNSSRQRGFDFWIVKLKYKE